MAQGVQLATLPLLEVPGAQGEQDWEAEARVDLSPGGHGQHLVDLDTAEYCPAGQEVHAVAPAALNLPAGQSVHMPAPAAALKVPAGHGMQVPVA